MKQINLLPHNLQQRSANKKLVTVGAMALLVGLLASGVLYTSVKVINSSFEDTSTVTARPAASATPKSQGNIQSRVTAINSLTATEVDWQKAFSLVQGLVAKNLITTAYTITVDQGTSTIKTVGSAPNNVAFASYIQSLQADNRVRDVKVDTYTYAPDKGTVGYALTVAVDPTLMRYLKQ